VRRRAAGSVVASIALMAGVLTTSPPRAAATTRGLNGVIAGIGGFNDRITLLNMSDGTRSSFLTGGSEETNPAWSPSGDKLVVTTGSDLLKLNADGTGKQTLVSGGCGGSGGMWSPDGTKIAYHTCTDIAIVNADGTSPTVVPNTSTMGTGEWSPDGQWLLVSRWTEGDHDIWKIRPDGNDLTQLTDLPGDQLSPTVSPDGSMIAFEDREAEEQSEISVVGIEGGPVTNLTQNGANDFSPSWSPDGTMILFGSARAGGGLFTMAADGSSVAEVPGGDGIGDAVWQSAQVAVSLSRSVVASGGTIQLHVRLAWPGTDNPSVVVQRRTTSTGWANWRTADVDTSGLVSLDAVVREHTWFRAVWSGDSSHLGARSIQARVRAKVTVTGHLFRFYATDAGWHVYHAGRRIWYTSDIVPNHSGRMCFELQRFRHGKWRPGLFDCYKIGTNGVTTIYIFNIPPGFRGRVRAVFRGVADHLGDVSPWDRFRVTR
jgi:TolB protein